MSIIECPECKKEISDKAKACPHCGAKPPSSKALLYALIGALVIFVTYALTHTKSKNEEAQSVARYAIANCWKEQDRKSLTPSEARFIAGACERMEQNLEAGKRAPEPPSASNATPEMQKLVDKSRSAQCQDELKSINPANSSEKRLECSNIDSAFKDKYGHAP